MVTKRLAIHLLGNFRVSVGASTIDEREWTWRRTRRLVKLLTLAPHHTYYWGWIGLGVHLAPNNTPPPNTLWTRPPNTLWEWIQWLMPLLCSGASFSTAATVVGLRYTGMHKQLELALAEKKYRMEALDTYLRQTTDLLLDRKLRESKENDDVRAVARAQTLTALLRLEDGHAPEQG